MIESTGGEQGESGEREPGPDPGPSAAKSGSVDEQVGLGVEVATERGDAAGEARELAVGVVEHRLELQEQRGGEERAAGRRDGGAEAGGGAGENDGGRRHTQRQQPRATRWARGRKTSSQSSS